jgi:hypothetical protein
MNEHFFMIFNGGMFALYAPIVYFLTNNPSWNGGKYFWKIEIHVAKENV